MTTLKEITSKIALFSTKDSCPLLNCIASPRIASYHLNIQKPLTPALRMWARASLYQLTLTDGNIRVGLGARLAADDDRYATLETTLLRNVLTLLAVDDVRGRSDLEAKNAKMYAWVIGDSKWYHNIPEPFKFIAGNYANPSYRVLILGKSEPMGPAYRTFSRKALDKNGLKQIRRTIKEKQQFAIAANALLFEMLSMFTNDLRPASGIFTGPFPKYKVPYVSYGDSGSILTPRGPL